MKHFYSSLILCFFLGCSPSESKLSVDMVYSDTGLELLNSTILGSEDYFDPSSANLTFKKVGVNYAFMSRGGVIRIYDSKGDRVFLFDKKALDNTHEFPGSLPVAFEFDDRKMSLFVLFAADPKLYEVDSAGRILSIVELGFPSNLWFQRAPYLVVDRDRDRVFISSGEINSETKEGYFFENSPLMSAFDLRGNFLYSFGNYPDEYAQAGKFSRGDPFRYSQYLYSNGGHSFLFDIEAKLHLFDNLGNNIGEKEAISSKRSYEFKESRISHFSDESLKAATNDVNYFISRHESREIYYVGIQRLTEAHTDHDNYLIKFDYETKSVSEVNLTDVFGIQFHPRLPSIIRSDTLDFFLSSPFHDEVIVYKALIKNGEK